MTRIESLFDGLRGKRPALIAYIVAGDPSPEALRKSSRLWSAAARI